MNWHDVYILIGMTPAERDWIRATLINERLTNMCTIAEASDLIEFEKPTPNHVRVLKQATDTGKAGYFITRQDIQDWHAQLFPYGGVWRTSDVYLSGSYRSTPPAIRVAQLMYSFQHNMLWQFDHASDPYRALAELHYEFVTIHPFTDGNGRIGRILLNYCAAYYRLPLIKITPDVRDEYLDCLETGNTQALAELFKTCIC